MSDSTRDAPARIKAIGDLVHDHFADNKRVLSFAEYMALVEQHPRRHLRNAAQYLVDMFDHYGTEEVRSPAGMVRRFKLFDAPWEAGERGLIGQEAVQNAIYRILDNFVRQGRVDRFILLHGPNGSSKSTVVDVIARAMEHYSTLEEGAVYRFNWIFPTQGVERTGIGFGTSGEQPTIKASETFAHLDEAAIDARLPCEQRDHPLLLVPKAIRRELLAELLAAEEVDDDDRYRLSTYLLEGQLSHKSKMIYEALLNAYEGDYLRVLRHVQVERFYCSRRYREAIARVEPQLAVDARMQQVTADRSLGALPTALQNVALYESDGQLVRGNRGLIDFADLFKRPIEAFKYLLTAVEDGRVAVEQANLFLDMVFIGSANETHLNAFMQSPEWMSFKARFELVRVPYLLDYRRELQIYEAQIAEEEAGKPIAPHTIEVAALWAVLTRMHRPDADRYDEPLQELIASLTPLDKARIYGEGRLPEGVLGEPAKLLRAALPEIYRETTAEIGYEGRTGASPREVRTAIMNAAQNAKHRCLSPEAVLEELSELVKETSVYQFLRQEPRQGFHEHAMFIDTCRAYYLDVADTEVRHAMGLVEESQYGDLFGRYINHVTHYVRKEKLRNEVTGRLDDPDERLMSDIEGRLDVDGDADEFRQGIMTKIGAWSLDHQGERPDYTEIFPQHFHRLQEKYFGEQRQRVARLLQHALRVLTEDASGLSEEEVAQVRRMLERLDKEHGYGEVCAREVITSLVKRRYSE
ncbi:MAG: serine protein kinase [Proteobacteria bacterium]|nr:MAG: serine protein kinase [Pseudomonadota bacterium]